MVDTDIISERRAPVIVGAFLLSVYAVTLAPGVTYWDSGEFLAAARTLGIPHPPGTPLFILITNVWAKLLGPFLGFAYSINLFSAICTAAACALFAWLMIRWTHEPVAATAAGICAGLMSSVWLNANETEVYSPSLLWCVLLLVVAQKASGSGRGKWLVLLAYLCGLGWSLQLSAVLAAPAAVLLAFNAFRDGWIPRPHTSFSSGRLRLALSMIVVACLGASAVFFMLVRAQHDPGVNQGNPATWPAFVDVLTRKQYMPVSMFPRQAPWYIQIGNLFEYADWQVALGLEPSAPPSWRRTPLTLLFGVLGAGGCIWHWRRDAASWRIMVVLFAIATLGVIGFLNMKAGPSYGHGFLPESAKHEARERDYFFALAFVCWGIWAGAGSVRLFANRPRWRFAGIGIAALPMFLNFPETDRARGPESRAAMDSAGRVLDFAPRRAVVFAYGDNDTYPVWYAQTVAHVRGDVTTVTIPLLGAEWYRAELKRRHALLSDDFVTHWRGFDRTIAAVCGAASSQGRPVVATPVRERLSIPEECARAATTAK